MAEGEWHKKVRKELIKKYEEEGYQVESSHENKVIGLYRGEPSRSTFLSDADLVLLKDDSIVKIIEIKDKDITPKNIAGIVTITDMCSLCKINDKPYTLSDIELIITYKKQKDESKKPEQFQLIKESLRLDGCLKSFIFEEVV